MLVFLTQLCELLFLNLLSGWGPRAEDSAANSKGAS
jgi:hypothetical protein